MNFLNFSLYTGDPNLITVAELIYMGEFGPGSFVSPAFHLLYILSHLNPPSHLLYNPLFDWTMSGTLAMHLRAFGGPSGSVWYN